MIRTKDLYAEYENKCHENFKEFMDKMTMEEYYWFLENRNDLETDEFERLNQ